MRHQARLSERGCVAGGSCCGCNSKVPGPVIEQRRRDRCRSEVFCRPWKRCGRRHGDLEEARCRVLHARIRDCKRDPESDSTDKAPGKSDRSVAMESKRHESATTEHPSAAAERLGAVCKEDRRSGDRCWIGICSATSTSVCFNPRGTWLGAGSLWTEPHRGQIASWMEPMVLSDTSVNFEDKINCETLEANEMMTTLNKVVMPLTNRVTFMWTVPTRLDQTQPSASGSSHDVRRTRGKWKRYSSEDGRAWNGNWERNWNDCCWARSEEEKASEWT